ncbi:MAG: hypothetical protein FIB08_06145 [Candidatus Methanoperedens sp.]|nr:hypothetical protein [Candidatus Methanoperedens sp.]
MITPTVIILLELLFSDGTSHPVKATYGSPSVSGCGCRYGNSAQHLTILHFPSLHAEAAPHGGIFTLGGHGAITFLFMSCCLFFLSYVSRHASRDLGLKSEGIRKMLEDFAYLLASLLSFDSIRRKNCDFDRILDTTAASLTLIPIKTIV